MLQKILIINTHTNKQTKPQNNKKPTKKKKNPKAKPKQQNPASQLYKFLHSSSGLVIITDKALRDLGGSLILKKLLPGKSRLLFNTALTHITFRLF